MELNESSQDNNISIKYLINRFLKSRSAHNGIWLYLLQIFNTIIPLFTLPYITRILGPSEYGIFNIALNFIGYLQVIVEYGFTMSATRRIVGITNKFGGVSNTLTLLTTKRSKSEKTVIAQQDAVVESISELFSSIIASRFILLISSGIIVCLYVLFYMHDTETIYCLILLFMGLFGIVIQQNWMFQGLQDMKYISITFMVARTISVVCVFLFVKESDDLIYYCLFQSGTTIIDGLVGFLIAKFKYHLKFYFVKIKNIANELKDGWYVFTTQISGRIFGAIGITFLGIFSTSTEVGLYSAIQKIPAIIGLLWGPIAQVLYPISSSRIMADFNQGKDFILKIRRHIVPLFGLGNLILMIFSRFIIRIAFGEDYISHFYWVIPLLIWNIVAIDNNFFGIQILLGSGHDKEYSRCFFVSVIATIVSNFVLIYFFGGNGACLAPLLAEIILGILLRKEIKSIENVN